MDTYRVQLPHPQPIENEEEFVTNSGRKIKRPNVEHDQEMAGDELKLTGGENVNNSGVSVLSPDSIDKELSHNGELSDSVQAELHLSLDRLSENYDQEELKKLQEKSKRSKTASRQSEQRRISSRGIETPELADNQNPATKFKQGPAILQDSLDTEILEHIPIPAELDVSTSEEFVVSGDDDRTIVADSLNYQSFGDGVTAMSSAHSSKKSDSSNKSQLNRDTNQHEDQYADLRYNPNFRSEQLEKARAATDSAVDHLHDIHQIDDSLEEAGLQKRSGGAIVIHKKGLYSPVTPKWEDEAGHKLSARSISPTRLSADPVRLQQTNALYEEEFNKMLKAEILNNPDIPEETPNHPDQQFMSQDSNAPRTESYSVLIRKIEQQDKRYPSEEPIRIGGYQLLPDRHRIPSPGRGMNMNNTEMPMKKQKTPKKLMTPSSYQPPDEYYYTGKKDPLVAISPREKKKVSIVPTPPRMPKPKEIDYIELNKQRLNRKTNSAGYLDLHRKRSRQTELLETRSQSEIKRSTVQQSPRHDQYPPAGEYPPSTLEELWMRQVERLKAAKNQNAKQGNVLRRPNHHGYNQGQSERERIEEGRNFHPYFQQFPNDGVNPAALQQNSGNMRARQPLPIPSQATHFSPRHFTRPSPGNRFSGDTATNNQDMYYSPRLRPVEDHESPLMRAYEARYATDVYQPKVINENSGNILRQNVNERNVLPQSQREADVWMNPNNEQEPLNDYMSQISSKLARRVTFVGDNEPVAIEGLDEFSSSISGSGYGLNRYKVPLPPTPPSKSQRHAVQRMKFHHEEKENDAGYYDVREDSYPVLPPILKQSSKKSPLKQSPNGENESKNADDNGSYFEQYEKDKSNKRFQYKIYTLNDYKNLKKDVKLGGLGPDMETARKKMQKMDRAKQYAEIIRKEHMSSGVIKKKENIYETRGVAAPGFDEKHHFSATMDEEQRKDMLERRTRAIEYSKSVPKPKIKPVMNVSQRSEIDSNFSSNTPNIQPDTSSPDSMNFNYGLLAMMKERHEKEKAQVAAFATNG